MQAPESRFTSTDAGPDKYQIALWLAVVALAIALSLSEYQSFQVGAYSDDARYSVLARSLVESDHYGSIHTGTHTPETRCPFGYPFIIAPFAALFPGQVDALKFPSLIATVMNAILLFWGWRLLSGGLSCWLGLSVTALYVLSPLTIGHSRMVMSEAVFTTFCLASLILVERIRGGRHGIATLSLLSVCLLFVASTRTVGVVLIAAVFGYLLLVRGLERWKEIAVVATGMVVLFGIIVAVTPVAVRDVLPSAYVDQFAAPSRWNLDEREDSLVTRFAIGVAEYFGHHIRQTVVPLGGGEREQALAARLGIPFLLVLPGLLLTGLIALGYARWARLTGVSAAMLFSVAYLAIAIVWPWRGPRLLYPIQPQLQTGLLLGLSAVLSLVIPRPRRNSFVHGGVMATAVLLLVSLSSNKSAQIDDSIRHTGDLRMRSVWLREHSDAASVVMTDEPHADYLYSGRRTVDYDQDFRSIEECERFLTANKVDYVLVAPPVQWHDAYAPAYDARASTLLNMMETLAREGRATVAAQSDKDLLKIFKVTTSEGS